MQGIVYGVIEVRCAVAAAVPIGTHLGLVHLLWRLVSGRVLETREAVIPGLSATGLSEPAVRRAWVALGQGDWTSAGLLARWQEPVEQGGRWPVHAYEGYRPVAVDVTGCWRPRLRGCATSHDHGPAGQALPAIPIGLVARVGSIGTPRLGVPLAFVRADDAEPRPAAHERALLGAASACVSAPETCQRLPALALLAGSILTYLAATLPAIPTGSWDRRPRPTPGRLRRRLAHTVFPTACPLPDRIRHKAAVTAHVPKGCWGQRRPRSPVPAPASTSRSSSPQAEVA